MGTIIDLIFVVLLLFVCFFTGSTIEKKHYKSIKQREIALYKAPFITCGTKLKSSKVKKAFLVSGSVVIGCDHFKAFLASLRNIFGGNVSAFESVLDRGRREAVLRVREKAMKEGARTVANLKIETVMLSPLGTNKNQQVCVTAYGTAIKYD